MAVQVTWRLLLLGVVALGLVNHALSLPLIKVNRDRAIQSQFIQEEQRARSKDDDPSAPPPAGPPAENSGPYGGPPSPGDGTSPPGYPSGTGNGPPEGYYGNGPPPGYKPPEGNGPPHGEEPNEDAEDDEMEPEDQEMPGAEGPSYSETPDPHTQPTGGAAQSDSKPEGGPPRDGEPTGPSTAAPNQAGVPPDDQQHSEEPSSGGMPRLEQTPSITPPAAIPDNTPAAGPDNAPAAGPDNAPAAGPDNAAPSGQPNDPQMQANDAHPEDAESPAAEPQQADDSSAPNADGPPSQEQPPDAGSATLATETGTQPVPMSTDTSSTVEDPPMLLQEGGQSEAPLGGQPGQEPASYAPEMPQDPSQNQSPQDSQVEAPVTPVQSDLPRFPSINQLGGCTTAECLQRTDMTTYTETVVEDAQGRITKTSTLEQNRIKNYVEPQYSDSVSDSISKLLGISLSSNQAYQQPAPQAVNAPLVSTKVLVDAQDLVNEAHNKHMTIGEFIDDNGLAIQPDPSI